MNELWEYIKLIYRFFADMNEPIGLVIVGIGVLFNIFGSIGLIRMPDVYSRLQAATKNVTFGTFFLLIGVFIYFGVSHLSTGIKALLCALFVFMTVPIASHAIAKASHIAGIKLWEKSVMDRYAEDNEGKNPK